MRATEHPLREAPKEFRECSRELWPVCVAPELEARAPGPSAPPRPQPNESGEQRLGVYSAIYVAAASAYQGW